MTESIYQYFVYSIITIAKFPEKEKILLWNQILAHLRQTLNAYKASKLRLLGTLRRLYVVLLMCLSKVSFDRISRKSTKTNTFTKYKPIL